MNFYDFYAARNDIEYSVRKYANNTIPSFAVISEALAEHLVGAAPANFGIIERTAFRAADAMRTYVQASASMSDADRAFGDMGPVYALWREADERMTELHAVIAAEFGCEDVDAADV